MWCKHFCIWVSNCLKAHAGLWICRWQSDSFIGGLCCQSEVGVGDCGVSTPLGHTSPYGFSNTLFIIPKHGTKTQPPHTHPPDVRFGPETLLWLHAHCYVSVSDSTLWSFQICHFTVTNDKLEISLMCLICLWFLGHIMHLSGNIVFYGGRMMWKCFI